MVNKTTQVRLKLLTHQSTCRTCVNKNIFVLFRLEISAQLMIVWLKTEPLC